jgi:hypothetical protein
MTYTYLCVPISNTWILSILLPILLPILLSVLLSILLPTYQLPTDTRSDDGGRSWTDTGTAFDLTVAFTDGSTRELLRRERPHVIVDESGAPGGYIVYQ